MSAHPVSIKDQGKYQQLASVVLIVIGCCMPASGTAAENRQIYKRVTPDGTVVFSDRQAPDSTVVTSTPLNILASPPAAKEKVQDTAEKPEKRPSARPQSHARAQDRLEDDLPKKIPVKRVKPASPIAQAGDIKRIDIIAPSQQQTLFDHEKTFKVHYYTFPSTKMNASQQARVYLNDAVVAVSKKSQVSVPMPARGEHRVHVDIVNEQGKIVAKSAMIDVSVDQLVIPFSAESSQ